MIGLPCLPPPPNVEGMEDKVEEVTQGEERRHGKWKKKVG